MNKAAFLNVAFLFCFFFVFFFPENADAVETTPSHGEPVITLVSTAPTELLPGQILNLSFLIVNNSGSEAEFVEDISLPEGFVALFPTETINLKPFESKPTQISLRLSRGVPAGKHGITYSLSSKLALGKKIAFTSTVTVSSLAKLTMRVEEKPDNIIAGESFHVKVRVVNEGNATVNALLKVADGKNFRVKVEPKEISLPPGSGTSVLMNVFTEIGERRTETLFLNLNALDSKLRDKKPLETISVGVEKIPRACGIVDLNRRVPAMMTVKTIGEGTSRWSQISIAGFGSLGNSDNRRLDFLIRTPDQQEKLLFGLRDEFHFDYFTDNFSFRAGDESCNLSSLTNYYSYGRGFELNFNQSKATRFGFFRLSNRSEDPDQTQLGVYVGRDLNDKIKLKVNHFRQEQSAFYSDIGPKKTITSLNVDCSPVKNSSLNFELGQSTIAGKGQTNDNAYRIQYQGMLGKQIRVTADKIRANPDYAGSVRDMEYSLGIVEFPILSWLQGRAKYSQHEQNLGFVPTRGAAPKENLWQFGINGKWRYGINFSVDLDRLRRFDRLLPMDFDSREKAYRTMLGKSWKRFDLRWEVRHSRRSETVGTQETWNDSHSYFGAFRPTHNFFLSVYGGFSKNQGNSRSFLLRDFNNLGINSRWNPTERLSLSLWYLKYAYSGARNETSQGNLCLDYQLPNKASITFNARNNISWSAEKGPTFYELYYSIPIDIPIGKNTAMGNLSGKVIDAELTAKSPIPNVILIMGGTAAVTDKTGRFFFPAMAVGTYTLTIERKSVGFNRICSKKMPMTIRIVGGKTTRVEIEMVKGSQLKGKFSQSSVDHGVSETRAALVLTGDAQQILKKSPAISLGNILVELSQEGEIIRRVSDNDGEFLFDALKPGTWHYKIYEENLPENHYLKNPEGEFNLGSGVTKEVTFDVLAKRREIQIVDEGEIKLQQASPR